MKKISVLWALLLFIAGTSLCAGATVKGTVADTEGKPILGAAIKFLRYDNSARKAVGDVVHSDAQGKFTFEGTCNTIQATANGYSVWGGYPSSGDVSITLFPEARCAGKVVDENGKPVSGAKVSVTYVMIYGPEGKWASNYSDHDGSGILPIITTGKDGTFALRHIPDLASTAQFTAGLSVSKPGRAKITYWLSREGTSEFSVMLPVGCTLRGRLLKPDGSPVGAGSNLMALVQMPRGMETRSAKVGSNGSYEFTELPPGNVSICRVPTGQTGVVDDSILPISKLVLASGKTVSHDLREVKASIVKGTVFGADGKPISRVNLMVSDGSRTRMIGFRDVSDEQGNFVLAVAPGDVRVAVQGYSGPKGWVDLSDVDSAGVEMALKAGEDKKDVQIRLTNTLGSYALYSLARQNPVPSDLILTPGTYHLNWDADLDLSRTVGSGASRQGASLKEKIKGLNRLVSKKPFLAEYPFDSSGTDIGLYVVCDESKGTGTGYDVAYIDSNRDGSILGEQPLRWSGEDGEKRTSWVEVQSHQGDMRLNPTTHPRMVRLNVYSAPNYFQAMPQQKGNWKGAIETNKGKIGFVVVDASQNGRYDDKFSLQGGEGDCCFADINGVGQVVSWRGSGHELHACDLCNVAGKFYQIRVNSTGDEVDISPYIGPVGTVSLAKATVGRLSGKLTTLAVTGDKGIFNLSDSGKPLTLPAGKYSIAGCEAELSSKRGPMKISVALSKSLEIRPNEDTSVEIKGNISTRIDPECKTTVLNIGGGSSFQWLMSLGDGTTIASIDNLSSIRVRLFDERDKMVFSGTAGST